MPKTSDLPERFKKQLKLLALVAEWQEAPPGGPVLQTASFDGNTVELQFDDDLGQATPVDEVLASKALAGLARARGLPDPPVSPRADRVIPVTSPRPADAAWARFLWNLWVSATGFAGWGLAPELQSIRRASLWTASLELRTVGGTTTFLIDLREDSIDVGHDLAANLIDGAPAVVDWVTG